MSTAAAARKRDAKVIGLVGTAHFFSHFFQLALPPLFPLIHAEADISYVALGGLTGLFYAASGLFQTPAGFLVDRFGARVVLIAGLALMAVATLVYGNYPRYQAMAVAAVAAGIGNSVFHPSDYSILSATVSPERTGRAYSMHNFGGYVGFAAAPVAMAAAGAAWGWRAALVGAGLGGLVLLAAIVVWSAEFRDSTDERAGGAPRSLAENVAILLQTPILLCFVFFLLVAMGQIGLQSFSPTVLTTGLGLSLPLANGAVTAFLAAVPLGILLGGVIADRTVRHDRVIAAAYGVGGVAMACVGLVDLSLAAILAAYVAAGFLYGVAFPSRDMMVRRATPRGSTGKVFGFAYSGLDFGSMVTPVVFGWFVDNGIPRGMYLCVAALWAMSVLVLAASGRASARARAGEAG